MRRQPRRAAKSSRNLHQEVNESSEDDGRHADFDDRKVEARVSKGKGSPKGTKSSENRPSAASDAGGCSAATAVDMSSVFPTSKIKAQMYRDEKKMARIVPEGLEMIGSASANVLKQIVDAAKEKASVVTTKSASTTTTVRIITLESIREAVDKNPALHFLKPTLETVRDTDKAQGKQQTIYQRKRKPAAKAPADLDAKPPAKKLKSLKSLPKDVKMKPLSKLSDATKTDGDEAPLAEAISDAAAAKENACAHELVADDDDYD